MALRAHYANFRQSLKDRHSAPVTRRHGPQKFPEAIPWIICESESSCAFSLNKDSSNSFGDFLVRIPTVFFASALECQWVKNLSQLKKLSIQLQLLVCSVDGA